MQFSNIANKLGLIQDAWYLCNANSASYPLTHVTRNINEAYYDVQRIIWESVVSWQYDDSNNTDLPRLRSTLTHETQSYELPSTAQKIHRAEIRNSSGNWSKLKPIDAVKDLMTSEKEWLESPGMPTHYDLEGDMIVLYPPPHTGYVSASSGLALYVDRDVTLFTSASTTASPGFAPQFHRMLSLAAALDFETDVSQRKFLIELKNKLEKGLRKHYASRFSEIKSSIKPLRKRNWRQYI